MNNRAIKDNEREHGFKLLLMCFAAVMMLFAVDCVPEFATDSYATFATSQWKHMLYDNGRPINAAVYYLFDCVFRFSPMTVYRISYSFAIIFLTAALYVTARRMEEWCKSSFVSVAIAALLVVNLFFIEYFLFIEKGLFMLGVLCAAIAFDRTAAWFQNQRNSELALSAVMLIMAVYIYQVLPGIYVVLCLPYIVHYSENIKKFLRGNIVVASIYAVAMGVGLITTKLIFTSERLAEQPDLASTLALSLTKIRLYCVSSGYIAPKYYLVGIVVVLILLTGYTAVLQKKATVFLQAAYLCAGVSFTAFLPYFCGLSQDYAIRIMYPFASLPAVLLVNLLMNTQLKLPNGKTVLTAALICCFMVEIVSFTNIFVERYKCNQTDKYICSIIIDRIDRYERETGKTVRKIRVYHDADHQWAHPGMNSSRLISSAFDTPWSDVDSLEFYSGRHFNRDNPKSKYKQLFAQQDWITFCDDQLIFEDDVLHWCIY